MMGMSGVSTPVTLNHLLYTELWSMVLTLSVFVQVKYVQARDAGVYECQVGTEPKMSHFVQLNVVGESLHIHALFTN